MTSPEQTHSEHAAAAGRADPVGERITRRTVLKRGGALGAASVAASLLPASRAFGIGTGRSAASTPIRHVIIDCQENRSFDHYFGFAPFAGQYGVPAGYSQPDGHGGTVAPYEFTSLSTPDIGHS